jgi:hypothetical protein
MNFASRPFCPVLIEVLRVMALPALNIFGRLTILTPDISPRKG